MRIDRGDSFEVGCWDFERGFRGGVGGAIFIVGVRFVFIRSGCKINALNVIVFFFLKGTIFFGFFSVRVSRNKRLSRFFEKGKCCKASFRIVGEIRNLIFLNGFFYLFECYFFLFWDFKWLMWLINWFWDKCFIIRIFYRWNFLETCFLE